MKPFTTPIAGPAVYESAALAGADAAVDDLVARIARWETEAGTADAEADQLDGQLGALLLDDEAAGARAIDDIARLRAKAGAARAASGEAGRRLDTARRTVLLLRAGQLRARAVVLRARAEERQRKTDGLLQALAAHEGVSFAPKKPAGGDGLSVGIAPYTLTQRMGQEANRLDQLAVEQEQRAESGTTEQLAVWLAKDPLPVGPLEREFIPA